MLMHIISALVSVLSYQTEFASSSANITVDISSNVYVYHVKNISQEFINSVKIPQHSSYNFTAPDGWQIEIQDDFFKAWTEDMSAMILPGRECEFSCRVSSKGAVLGNRDIILGTNRGDFLVVSDVYVSVAESRTYIFFVMMILVAVIFLQTFVVIRKSRKAVSRLNHP